MRYLYECPKCNVGTVEVEKHHTFSGRLENCKICNTEMIRRYSSVGTKTNDGVKSAR